MEPDIQAALMLLHYNPKWLEYGFLDAQTLAQQAVRYHNSDDHNTEHYRYGAFRLLLANRTGLDEAEIARYIELAQADEDAIMGTSALIELLSWKCLTARQFETLADHPAYDDPRPQKLIARRRLYVALEAETLSQELFERCLASQHNGVQCCLLQHTGLSYAQLEQMVEQGVNKAVRNLATVTLRSRRTQRNKP